MKPVDGVVVDASVILRFSPQLARGEGRLYELITELAHSFGMVTDDGQKMEQEWSAGGSDQLILTWIAEEMKNGRLKVVRGCIDRGARRRLHAHFGLPRNSWDVEYIKCANVTLMKYLLAEDCDFFDPKAKAQGASARRKAKRERRGRLCQYLKKQLGIRVGAICHCRGDLGL